MSWSEVCFCCIWGNKIFLVISTTEGAKSYTVLEAGCQKVNIYVYGQKRTDEG